MTYFNRCCVLIFYCLLYECQWAHSAERPNILFIYSDDQNYNTLSCYPESPDWVQTPHIDALAEQGVRFERTYLGVLVHAIKGEFSYGRLQHGVQSMRMEGIIQKRI